MNPLLEYAFGIPDQQFVNFFEDLLFCDNTLAAVHRETNMDKTFHSFLLLKELKGGNFRKVY